MDIPSKFPCAYVQSFSVPILVSNMGMEGLMKSLSISTTPRPTILDLKLIFSRSHVCTRSEESNSLAGADMEH